MSPIRRIQNVFQKFFSRPWIWVAIPFLLANFVAIFVHFQNLYDRNTVRVVSADNPINFSFDKVWLGISVFVVCNFLASYWIEKRDYRYRLIFWNLCVFLITILWILIFIAYFRR